MKADRVNRKGPGSDPDSVVPPRAKGFVTLADAEREHILVALRETGWVLGGQKGCRGPLGDEAVYAV